MWGTDFDVDSYWGFNAKISYWTFRLLAQKEILAVVHSGKYGDASAWCAPRDGTHGIVAALPCVLWEKRKVWVVEGTPTGYTSPYAYSKRIFYIDQDFYGQLLQEMYIAKVVVGVLHMVTTSPISRTGLSDLGRHEKPKL